jgi:tetratricopeptide (TPR) repeat protein
VDDSRFEEMHKKYAGGRNFYNKGDFEHAIRTLEPVWLWNPNYEEVASYLTRSLLLSGLELYADQRYNIAIDRWKKALMVDPGNAKAERYLVRAREELQRIGQADND